VLTGFCAYLPELTKNRTSAHHITGRILHINETCAQQSEIASSYYVHLVQFHAASFTYFGLEDEDQT
jgi:hypothetical protein